MDGARVAAFTDTYHPTINGVTYTVDTWREYWDRTGGRMDIVYPASSHDPLETEHPVSSLPVPIYDGFRFGCPMIPRNLGPVDIVHAHTPFGLGIAGRRLATRRDLPFVVSYHTPTPAYAGYLTSRQPFERCVRSLATGYERRFLETADRIVVPTSWTAQRLRQLVETVPVHVVSNGVDTQQFAPRPAEARTIRSKLDIPDGQTVVGYTGRHGHEKDLETTIEAVDGLDRDLTVVLAGDGPARQRLERLATASDVRILFPGFVDRDRLPALYSLFDLFFFPSPVETQGLVALESIACGTPVVATSAGALSETIDDGATGLTVPSGDVIAFRGAIESVLDHLDQYARTCLGRRSQLDVTASIDELAAVYDDARQEGQ